MVHFVRLNKALQKDLNIQDRIRDLIYNNTADDKFVTDPHTESTKLNPAWLTGINEFNTFKKLVYSCADKQGQVNIEMIRSLVDQVNLRCKMLDLEQRLRGLELENEEEIYAAALFELSKLEPNSIISQMADQSQMIDNVDQKINNVQDSLATLHSLVLKKFELMDSKLNDMGPKKN